MKINSTMIKKAFLIYTLVCVFISMRSTGIMAAKQSEDYWLYPNDVIEISVYQEPDLTKSCTVSQEGTINYPLLGTIYVKGITAKDLEEKITMLLAADYMVEPYVSVVIKDHADYSIIGQVTKPGSYELVPGLTITEAIAQAGSFSIDADPTNVKLIRHNKAGEKDKIIVDVEQILNTENKEMDLYLQPQDMIIVGTLVVEEESEEDKEYVYVLGQVRIPGKYEFTEGMSVFALVSEAGGLTDIASPNKTKIIRPGGGRNSTVGVPLGAILRGDTSKDIELIPGDTVMVPESFF